MTPGAKTHFEKLIEPLRIAKEISEARRKSKAYQDKTIVVPYFALHDRVLLRVSKVPVGLSPKIFEKYDGSFYISEICPTKHIS